VCELNRHPPNLKSLRMQCGAGSICVRPVLILGSSVATGRTGLADPVGTACRCHLLGDLVAVPQQQRADDLLDGEGLVRS